MVSLSLIGCRYLVSELGWNQLCVFSCFFFADDLKYSLFSHHQFPNTLRPPSHIPLFLRHGKQEGGLMCEADLICRPKSMHGYEGVQLISLRKGGRGIEPWGISFYGRCLPVTIAVEV